MAYKISDDCVAYGQYKPECPVGCISEEDVYTIDQDACIDCGSCAGVCPVDAPHQDC